MLRRVFPQPVLLLAVFAAFAAFALLFAAGAFFSSWFAFFEGA